MKNLINNKKLIIQKSDKRNSVIVIDSTCNTKIGLTLSDQGKSLKVHVLDNNLLKLSISQEKHFDHFLKSLKDKQKSSAEKIPFPKTKKNTTKETFNETLYKQVDGVAMGSPLGATLANTFSAFHEKQWLKDSSLEFNPIQPDVTHLHPLKTSENFPIF